MLLKSTLLFLLSFSINAADIQLQVDKLSDEEMTAMLANDREQSANRAARDRMLGTGQGYIPDAINRGAGQLVESFGVVPLLVFFMLFIVVFLYLSSNGKKETEYYEEQERQEKVRREEERQERQRQERQEREWQRQEQSRQKSENSRKNSSEKSRSYEEVLGLSSGWTKSDLKDAYKRKCHQTHPDKWRTFPEDIVRRLEKEYKEVQNAYKHLSKK